METLVNDTRVGTEESLELVSLPSRYWWYWWGVAECFKKTAPFSFLISESHQEGNQFHKALGAAISDVDLKITLECDTDEVKSKK